MGPQVFEKSISCVNNLRLQAGRPIVSGHSIYVVDLQDGGNWDWTKGEPPKDNPAYYLRFCKSFSRMGGTMHYAQCDNVAFLHHLFHRLETLHDRTATKEQVPGYLQQRGGETMSGEELDDLAAAWAALSISVCPA